VDRVEPVSVGMDPLLGIGLAVIALVAGLGVGMVIAKRPKDGGKGRDKADDEDA